MSVILDALRRADAERQQGQIPGLYAAPEAVAPPQTSHRNWLVWSGVAAVLLTLAALLLVWWGRPPAVSTPLVMPPPPAAPAAAPPARPSLPIVVSAAPAAALATSSVVPTAEPTSLPRAPSATTPDAAPSAPLPKLVPLQQLAQDLRRELPSLVVGGSVWSPSAANRFIILDGLMRHEGDTVAKGLVLESIQPKSAVLRWRDLRLELSL